MLFRKDLFFLGIVLLLSNSNYCDILQNVTKLSNYEDEQETTHKKLQEMTLEKLQNGSEPEQDFVGTGIYKLDSSNVSDSNNKLILDGSNVSKDKLILDDIEVENDNKEVLGDLKPPKLKVETLLYNHESKAPNAQINDSNQDVRFPMSFYLRTFQLISDIDNAPVIEQDTDYLPIAEPVALELPPPKNTIVNEETKVVVKFEGRVPIQADSVRVECGEDLVIVDVKQNFLGNGQLIHPSDLTLGDCPNMAAKDQIVHFQTELQACGSTMTMLEDALVYGFTLFYNPTPIGRTFILKTNPAEVVIECHYPRKQYVSSDAIAPTWFPFAAHMLAERPMHFTLQLMTGDWGSPRRSNVYFLDDVMHLEAMVLEGGHVPLRVFVDYCVATAQRDSNSQPRYEFVNNHGCLLDSKLTGSSSYFLQRTEDLKLHFKINTFRFTQLNQQMYITCRLKATTLSVPIDSQNKACSFINEAQRWIASDGDNKVCGCCENSCDLQRTKRELREETAQEWEEMTTLGPIIFKFNYDELSNFNSPKSQDITEATASQSLALFCALGVVLGIILLLLFIAINLMHKPKEYSVYI